MNISIKVLLLLSATLVSSLDPLLALQYRKSNTRLSSELLVNVFNKANAQTIKIEELLVDNFSLKNINVDFAPVNEANFESNLDNKENYVVLYFKNLFNRINMDIETTINNLKVSCKTFTTSEFKFASFNI